jgi:hypothetical protein
MPVQAPAARGSERCGRDALSAASGAVRRETGGEPGPGEQTPVSPCLLLRLRSPVCSPLGCWRWRPSSRAPPRSRSRASVAWVVLGWWLVAVVVVLDRARHWARPGQRAADVRGVRHRRLLLVCPRDCHLYGRPWSWTAVLLLFGPICSRSSSPSPPRATGAAQRCRLVAHGADRRAPTSRQWACPKLFADTIGHGLPPAAPGSRPGWRARPDLVRGANACVYEVLAAAIRPAAARCRRACARWRAGRLVALLVSAARVRSARYRDLPRCPAAPVRAGIVQADISHEQLAAELGTFEAVRLILDAYSSLSAELRRSERPPPDLLVWPGPSTPPRSAPSPEGGGSTAPLRPSSGMPAFPGVRVLSRRRRVQRRCLLEPSADGRLTSTSIARRACSHSLSAFLRCSRSPGAPLAAVAGDLEGWDGAARVAAASARRADARIAPLIVTTLSTRGWRSPRCAAVPNSSHVNDALPPAAYRLPPGGLGTSRPAVQVRAYHRDPAGPTGSFCSARSVSWAATGGTGATDRQPVDFSCSPGAIGSARLPR